MKDNYYTILKGEFPIIKEHFFNRREVNKRFPELSSVGEFILAGVSENNNESYVVCYKHFSENDVSGQSQDCKFFKESIMNLIHSYEANIREQKIDNILTHTSDEQIRQHKILCI